MQNIEKSKKSRKNVILLPCVKIIITKYEYIILHNCHLKSVYFCTYHILESIFDILIHEFLIQNTF